MKVMVFVKASEESEAGVMPSRELLTEMGKYNEALVNTGVLVDGDGLRSSSHGVRVRYEGKQRSTVDGPFAESKELVAGYWVWKVDSMEQAIEWAKKAPFEGGEVEIRPFFDPEDFDEAFTPALREAEERLRKRTEENA